MSIHELRKGILTEAKHNNNWAAATELFAQLHAVVQSRLKVSRHSQNFPLSKPESKSVKIAFELLVRYAPTVSEANHYYLILLKEYDPPIRDDECVNYCLISLIYKYAKSFEEEYWEKGLGLVQVALDRGLGLPTYVGMQSNTNVGDGQVQRAPRESANGNQKGILANVSKEILKHNGLRIAQDGSELERDPHEKRSFRRPGGANHVPATPTASGSVEPVTPKIDSGGTVIGKGKEPYRNKPAEGSSLDGDLWHEMWQQTMRDAQSGNKDIVMENAEPSRVEIEANGPGFRSKEQTHLNNQEPDHTLLEPILSLASSSSTRSSESSSSKGRHSGGRNAKVQKRISSSVGSSPSASSVTMTLTKAAPTVSASLPTPSSFDKTIQLQSEMAEDPDEALLNTMVQEMDILGTEKTERDGGSVAGTYASVEE